MWVKLDDNLPAHHKLAIAGRQIGRQATGRALAIFVEALCWTNKHMTNGFLPSDVVGAFQHDRDPLQVAAALVRARFWEPADGGWKIHNWAKYQLDEVRRAAIAKARSEAGRKGAASRWQIASESAPKHSKKNGKTWQTDSKAMAKNAPGPVPFASKEAKKIRARETVRAESPAGPATASAPSGGGQKKHQPRTTGATRCPHTPMCPSYDACIQRTLDDANARS